MSGGDRNCFLRDWRQVSAARLCESSGRFRAGISQTARTAIGLLQSGVAFSVIALWLGHESMSTTHQYVEADLAMKEKALASLQEPDTKMHRFQPPDALMRFLQGL